MIIDAKTIAFTLAVVSVASYFGLQLIRSFALSIAQENHDANLATDMSVEAKVSSILIDFFSLRLSSSIR